jgi:hypothetical protein
MQDKEAVGRDKPQLLDNTRTLQKRVLTATKTVDSEYIVSE